MKRIFFAFFSLFGFAAFVLCSDVVDTPSSTPNDDGLSEWLIPKSQIFDGGPGKDGIPALFNPNSIPAAAATYLFDSDLVVGVVMNGEARAYPHLILEWHEIANDDLGNYPICVTLCPLTGSAIGWGRMVNSEVTTFGVSGLLHKNNLIPYDRLTDSNWSQMKNMCVNGQLIGSNVQTFHLVETTWGTWKKMYPETTVLSLATGYDRNYGPPVYGDYNFNNNAILFPLVNDDPRLPRKERVHGVIVNNEVKAYRFSSFPIDVGVINDTFKGKDIVVVGSRLNNFVVSFERTLPGVSNLTFEPLQDSLPIVMKDNEGTTWDVFGNGISGPRAGQKLTPMESYIAFWFAWGDFYPNAEIYNF